MTITEPTTISTGRRPAPTAPPGEDMVWVPGREYVKGSDDHHPEEAPAHRVAVDGFWMDQHLVTNAEFSRFVDDTGHVTLAECGAEAEDYPDASPEELAAASTVFRTSDGWATVTGADWRHPRGPRTSIAGLETHPVVHLAWDDVVAYASWAGKALPTEAEWELAARGGLDDAEYAWGDELNPGGLHLANLWQGAFPFENLVEDGFEHTSPVETFPPNVYGVFDMIGNVWEWTADWYVPHAELSDGHGLVTNPTGGAAERSCDPTVPQLRIPRKVIKGGSHLSDPKFCRRYRPAARLGQAIDITTSHLGFRCIVRP